MADEKKVTSLRQQIVELVKERKDRRRLLAEAGSVASLSAVDLIGGGAGLTMKVAIEATVDYFRKTSTPKGQFRPPSMLSGGIAIGTGFLIYVGNLIPKYQYPLSYFRDSLRTFGSSLGILGSKEFFQAGWVYVENKQLASAAQAQLNAPAAPAGPPAKTGK